MCSLGQWHMCRKQGKDASRSLQLLSWGSETNPLVQENHIKLENQKGLRGKVGGYNGTSKVRILKDREMGRAFQAEGTAQEGARGTGVQVMIGEQQAVVWLENRMSKRLDDEAGRG